MMFTKRKRAQALIAQSLYEPLDDAERAELNALLDRLPDLRQEAEAFKGVVASVPVSEVSFEGDLRPAVMAALTHRTRTRLPVVPHWALTAAAFVLVASGVTYWIVAHPPAAVAPGPVASHPAETAVSTALGDAAALIGSRDFARAYTVLARAVEAAPDDPQAGYACQMMADLAFDELQWYPEAFAGYDALRHRYVDQFRAAPENFTRINLLDEQRGPDNAYANLRALDAARRDGSFERLEDFAARFPATYLASAASDDMARIVAEEEGLDPVTARVQAMQVAESRSTNAVAKAQLRLEMAHLLAALPDERDRAREMYVEIAEGPITTVAEAARKSLAIFDGAAGARPEF